MINGFYHVEDEEERKKTISIMLNKKNDDEGASSSSESSDQEQKKKRAISVKLLQSFKPTDDPMLPIQEYDMAELRKKKAQTPKNLMVNVNHSSDIVSSSSIDPEDKKKLRKVKTSTKK